MARLFDDASSQYLQKQVAPVTGPPFTMACWFRADDDTIAMTLMWLGLSTSAADGWMLRPRGNIAGDPLTLAVATSAGTNQIDTTTGFTINTWHHACARIIASNNRNVRIDGGSEKSTTVDRAPATPNRISIGREAQSSPTRYFSGRIAEAGLWNVSLSDNEVVALSRRIPPWRIRPGSLVGYWPIWGLHSPEIDLTNQKNSLTVTGATAANHAPVRPLSRMVTFPQSVGAAAADDDFVGPLALNPAPLKSRVGGGFVQAPHLYRPRVFVPREYELTRARPIPR